MPGITVKIDGDVGGLTKSLSEATKATTGFSVPAIAGMAGVAGIAVVAAGKIAEFTQAAAEDRAEQEKLETVYKNTGAAVGDYVGSIDAAIAAGADKAFSDSEVRAGLQPLITATGDADEANKLLATAMDVARFAGVDLETASKAVAKAAAGEDAQLKKLIPGLKKGATASDTIASAQAIAAGSADDYAESSEGMGKKSSNAFSEITETIGAAFLPILDALLPVVLTIVQALAEVVGVIVPLLIPAIKILATVLGKVLSVIVEVIKWLVPKLAPAIKFVTDVWEKEYEMLLKVIEVIKRVIDWVKKLIDWFSNIKVPEIKLPSIPNFGRSVPTAAFATDAATSRYAGAGASGGAGNIIININGDPITIERSVVQALRTYGRRNGIFFDGISPVARATSRPA